MLIRSALILAIVLFSNLAYAQSFNQQEVNVYNNKDGIVLAGTLTMPKTKSVKAALVLATGSGSQNRDEEVFGHKPFKAIAEFLSANGYAVLRMDDRGVGGSGGDPKTAVTDDFVTDISSALEKLDSLVNPVVAKGVLGHSEGGTVAIKTALKNPRCKFIITLGAPAWQGDSIIMSQARAIATAMTGKWDSENEQRRYLDMVKSDLPSYLLQAALYNEVLSKLGAQGSLKEVQDAVNRQVSAMVSPWYRSMVKYDPAEDISKVGVPWIALNGSKDMQVLPRNLQTIKELNPEAKICLMEDHNHLFQKCKTGMMQEYATIPDDISGETLKVILDFLESNFNQ